MPLLRSPASLLLAAALALGAIACCASSRPASKSDSEKAAAACRTRPRYSPSLSASMKADLDARCTKNPDACRRFSGSIAGVCAYQDKVATIPISERVEVYATLATSDDLALDELCAAMRSVSGVGFLQDVDVWIARDREPFWGKSWRRRCAQGSGSGGEHR